MPRAVALALLFLATLSGSSGCRQDTRPGSREGSEVVQSVAQDTVDEASQFAEVERVGPTAGTDPTALNHLGRAIRSPHRPVSLRAAYWLGQTASLGLQTLRASLADSSPAVRTSACYGLSLLGPKARAAVPALIRELAGANDSAANMADWALTQIDTGGRAALVPALRSLRYGTATDRMEAASMLALFGEASADAIPLLLRLLADSAGPVAASATDALVRIGSRSIPALESALHSDNPTVRIRARLALTRLRPYSHF